MIKDTSLKGLMMMGNSYLRGVVPVVPLPDYPDMPPSPENPIPDPIPDPIPNVYTIDDFGENAINNHYSSHASHSARVQEIFNYVTKDFRARCTSYESFRTTPINRMVSASRNAVLDACKSTKSDVIMIPYVNASKQYNIDYDDFVLPIGAHWGNDESDGVTGNDNRHDITTNAETFLEHSIAVSARRDTAEGVYGLSSWGYGMEFFEDCSKEGLDTDYPDKDIPIAFAEVRTSADGKTIYGNRTMDMKNKSTFLAIGEDIKLVHGSLSETRKIKSFGTDGSITVEEAFTPFEVSGHIVVKKLIEGVLTKIGEVGTEDSGKLLRAHNIATTNFLETVSIGDTLTLIYPNAEEVTATVKAIPKYDLIEVVTKVKLYNIPGIYVWYMGTLGAFLWGQAQSWAVPIIAGKLKVIKMTTNADWVTVRAAARATAKRNVLGIPELDNVSWDIYRGFGQVQVQAAIDYITNL